LADFAYGFPFCLLSEFCFPTWIASFLPTKLSRGLNTGIGEGGTGGGSGRATGLTSLAEKKKHKTSF